MYEGSHKSLGHKVAIKVLNPEFRIQENIRKRFLEEARRLARMSHPNLVKVSDFMEEGEMVAFVMEFIEGKNLRDYLHAKGRLSDAEIESFLGQMLDALGFVHQNGLVHRDIKPSNFMVTDSGKIKLLDFGIAKSMEQAPAEYTQTGTGVQMGTPIYMSPEQVNGAKNLNEKSDQYSLGVVLWEMVSGRKPYDADTLSGFQIQTKIVNEPLPLTGTHWDEVIQKATSKDPEKRFASLSEMLPSRIETPSDEADKTVLSDNGPTEEKMQETENNKLPALKDNRERARQLVITYWAYLIIILISILSNLYHLQYLVDIKNGITDRQYLSEVFESRTTYIDSIYIIINILTIFLFIKWFRRAYENAHELAGSKNMKYQKSEALWSWFIPFLNLYRPFKIANEIKVTLNKQVGVSKFNIKEYVTWMWWIFYLIDFMVQIGLNKYNLAESKDDIFIIKLTLFSEILTIISILTTVLMIKYFSREEKIVFEFYKESTSEGLQRKLGFIGILSCCAIASIAGFYYNFKAARIAGEVKLGSEAYNRNEFRTAYAVLSKEDVCEDKVAQYYLGVMHINGEGVSQDYDLAKKWFEKSAEQDDPDAQNYLGNMYKLGWATGGIKKPAEAFKWYMKSAEQGNAEGQNNVAMCYLNSDGIDYDTVEALRYCKLSAEQNFTPALNNLAWMYANGRCVEKNLTESFNYYIKSAQLGDADGQRELAMCYWNATGVENNFPEAETWLRLAVQQGDPDAHWFLGMLLFNGLTGPANQQEALDLLYKAVNLGVYGAANFLNQKGYQAAVKAP